MEGLKVVWSLLTKPSDKGIETSVSGEALPGCMLPVQIEQFGRLWAPPPADFGQQSLHPSEEGWARLLICRDRSRAGSGCNLTFQARCLPGCSGSCGHGIPGAEPHSTGRARCGGGSGSSWMPRLPGQLAGSRAGLSHPFSQRALPGFPCSS